MKARARAHKRTGVAEWKERGEGGNQKSAEPDRGYQIYREHDFCVGGVPCKGQVGLRSFVGTPVEAGSARVGASDFFTPGARLPIA